jgi:chromosome segregation ATPase
MHHQPNWRNPMKKPLRTTAIRTGVIASAVACTTLIGLGVAPAFADTPSTGSPTHTLAQIQAAGAAKTSARISSLTTAISTITANTHLTSGDKATILGTLNGDLAGMKTVEAKIAADTTRAEAAADYKTIFTAYRVYAVALPQARYTAAADNLSSVSVPRLTDVQHRLSALLSGKDSSKSTPALQADLADMNSQIATATTSLSGLAAESLAVTPAQYNANHNVLSALKQKLNSARAALKHAREDARTIVAALSLGKH